MYSCLRCMFSAAPSPHVSLPLAAFPASPVLVQFQLQTPQRLYDGNFKVNKGSYFRVHIHPKRFPRALRVDWASRIVLDAQEYVIVCKPWGVQVTHTVDNVRESLVANVTKVLGLAHEVHPVHRIDQGTEGLVVLAKTPTFARRCSTLLASNSISDKQSFPAGGDCSCHSQLQKTYLALTDTPLVCGHISHWAHTNVQPRGQPEYTRMVPSEDDGAVRCELEVVQVRKVVLGSSAAAQWGSEAWEHRIRLITGRTHQIRAQFAAMGAPLLGDVLYRALLAAGVIDLVPPCRSGVVRAEGILGSAEPAEAEAQTRHAQSRLVAAGIGASALPQWVHEYRCSTRRIEPLGLQACCLELHGNDLFGPDPFRVHAPMPWWQGPGDDDT